LAGERGKTRQMAMSLLLDLATAAGASRLIPIGGAHLSGVSPLTGGLGLRRLLARLSADGDATVAVPTTLNSAGCDLNQFERMRISVPEFREHSQEIIAAYERLGVQTTLSCVPYEWDGVVVDGVTAWAESNAICYGNSYCGLVTNRESGLSALAAAITGYVPDYGLTRPENRLPNLHVRVSCELNDPTDFSILGDWVGKQRQREWSMPFGPIPFFSGLPASLTHDQRKALSAAAANYGAPLLFIEGDGPAARPGQVEATLEFGTEQLQQRYEELRPASPVSLVALGCPQASVTEVNSIARLLKDRQVAVSPDSSGRLPLWVFTSSVTAAIAEASGAADAIRDSGALLLQDTCPEVVPYDPAWVSHVLTNSMKAEHYIKSGLNGTPTSVMTLEECVAMATGDLVIQFELAAESPAAVDSERDPAKVAKRPDREVNRGAFSASGRPLPSQGDFEITGEAFVTDSPITFLGFVNRVTGVIEEPGHPADGQSMVGKVAIFPRGSGSTVAPYVLLELIYRGAAPIAVVNSELDQQTIPACSLESLPYAHSFDADLFANIANGDTVRLKKRGDEMTLRVIQRKSD